ncbi:hypothetical protein ACH5RR_031356 [Cinchona calisaya]|uniref:Uncharacterized protein n=1 Tax=Cinchona calisaya TaxID=153742 RepID=A0ABD2YJ09_9GENT
MEATLGIILKLLLFTLRPLSKTPIIKLFTAAFLHLVKLNKALADAETTITLKFDWEKAMERYDDVCVHFLPYHLRCLLTGTNNQLEKEKRRAQEVEAMTSNVDLAKHLDMLISELSRKYGTEQSLEDIFSFLVETMEMAVKSWHETSKVDARVYFLLDKDKTDTEKYAPVVNIDKYAEDSFSRAACLVSPKSIISYPQVWKGQGTRKWKHGQSDGFFVQFETPPLRKLWFVPSSSEKGQMFCGDPLALDISVHEVLPRLFKEV